MGQYRNLKTRVDQLDKAGGEHEEAEETLAKRVEKLHQMLVEERGDVRSNATSLASRMEAAELEIRRLRGKNEEYAFQLERIRKQLQQLSELLDERFGISTAPLPDDLPTDPKGMMAAADERFERGLYRAARSIYRTLVRRHPKDKLAPRAWLRIGESYARENNFESTLRELTGMERNYGKTPEMAEAYLLVGAILEKQGQCRKALAVYEAFLDRSKKHARAGAIKARIARLKKDPACAKGRR
jgi:TolA-binding protein